jgi:hypothetical protein
MFSTDFRKSLIRNFTVIRHVEALKIQAGGRADGHTSNRRFTRIIEFGSSGSRYKDYGQNRVTTVYGSMEATGVYGGMGAKGTIM